MPLHYLDTSAPAGRPRSWCGAEVGPGQATLLRRAVTCATCRREARISTPLPGHPWAVATRETTPWHLWESAMLEIAGVGTEEARAAASRERIQRWYQAGESAGAAADMLRAFVAGARAGA